MVLLAIWTFGSRGVAGSADEVLLGRVPEETLTDQQEQLAVQPVEQQENAEQLPLEEVEPVGAEPAVATSEAFAQLSPPSASGSTAQLQFDVSLPGAGGTGGDWEGFVQQLRRNGLDIVIVFDSTGSMSGEINQVKQQIAGIMQSLLKLVPKTRVSLCTYRDLVDEYVTKGISLTNDIAQLQAFLAGVSAEGGGDEPEAVDEGLYWAVQNNTFHSPARKVILLFGDAPPHEQNRLRCVQIAATFHQQHKGIVSTVTCRQLVSLPEFVEIARAGGGEAFLLGDERQIMTQLMVLAFGSRYREKVIEALNLYEKASR
jgi:Mg-chelatase subunit ChlD